MHHRGLDSKNDFKRSDITERFKENRKILITFMPQVHQRILKQPCVSKMKRRAAYPSYILMKTLAVLRESTVQAQPRPPWHIFQSACVPKTDAFHRGLTGTVHAPCRQTAQYLPGALHARQMRLHPRAVQRFDTQCLEQTPRGSPHRSSKDPQNPGYPPSIPQDRTLH